MELDLRQAAALIGRRERTLRDQLVRGAIRGRKVGGRWVVREEDLPIDEARRQTLRGRADAVRASVETAIARRQPAMTIEDVEVFRLGREALHRLDAGHGEIASAIREALLHMGVAHHEYDAGRKQAEWGRARIQLARAVLLRLLPAATDSTAEVADALERDVIPRLGGLLRRTAERP
ncbi:MAG: hypothetical protein R3F60_15140 [bacterium]